MADGFRCVLCKSESAPFPIQDQVKGDASGTLRVVQCLACSHIQLSPPSYDLDLYRNDGQVNFVVSHYGTPIETLFDHSAIEAKRRVRRFAQHGETLVRAGQDPVRLLDVGGGYGFFGAAMNGMRPEVDTCVLEPSASRAQTGSAHFADRADPVFPAPAFEIGLLDDDFLARNRAHYDVVTLWHVLEHVEDPADLMARAGALLRPDGGSLWIEVPNVEDELARLSPGFRQRSFMHEHISYFSAAILTRMARRLFPDASIAVTGYQRYGIFNYTHWIEHNAPQGAKPDLWERDRWWLETSWRTAREAARTSDALLLIVRLGQNAGDRG
ncbi:MAG TPA: class I SAM-dependent methyltransferase [Sphingomonas sp.]|jgi:2-polyprenyl-3-methyl-5-hydroxy-6-metoxy-1,4-benzoquinol methylase|nr:class I SAM-dependent methyltransferase [Sphingomonas sp.]